jgi:Fe-S cluster biogenesis protein NfuA
MTPNPSSLKFVADRFIIENNDIAEFESLDSTIGKSALAEKLFSFPFVKSVFIMSNFVTVSKSADVDWDLVKNELREFIQRHLMESKLAVATDFIGAGSSDAAESTPTVQHNISNEMDEKIAGILDEYVKPAVERDGGAIHFQNFTEGVVTVSLKGSCSGCPSSTVTLKSGIETLLKSMLPEVQEVVAQDA